MFKSDVGKMKATIAKGKRHFILWNGVLGWGVTTGVLFSLIQYLSGNELSVQSLALNAVIWPVGGLLFGVLMWHFMNKEVAKSEAG